MALFCHHLLHHLGPSFSAPPRYLTCARNLVRLFHVLAAYMRSLRASRSMSAAFAISSHHCTPVAANDNVPFEPVACPNNIILLYPPALARGAAPPRVTSCGGSTPKKAFLEPFLHGPAYGARCARIYDAGGMMIGPRDQNGAIATTHTDHLGGTVSQTDRTGNVQWRQRYSPFGSELGNTTGTNDRAGFTGHIKDSTTGLN